MHTFNVWIPFQWIYTVKIRKQGPILQIVGFELDFLAYIAYNWVIEMLNSFLNSQIYMRKQTKLSFVHVNCFHRHLGLSVNTPLNLSNRVIIPVTF